MNPIKLLKQYFLHFFIFCFALSNLNFVSVQREPEFESSPETEATYGSLYLYEITIDADEEDLEVTVQSGDLPDGINLVENGGNYSLEGRPTETGDFPITLEVYEEDAPSENDLQSFTIEVSKALLSVTADDQSISYGDAIPPLTISYSGFVNGDDESDLATPPTASTTATASSNAGNYPITVSGGVSNNYEFDYTAGTLSIAKNNQTITFNAITNKTYGDQAFELIASSDSGLPVTFTVISGPASVSGNILSINGAGNVTVEANQAGNINYDPATPVSRSFVVSKATLSVTADDKSIVYGDALPTLTISYSGFANGDDESDLTTAPTASTTADANSNAGNYPITVSGGVSDNYTFDYTAGTLSIAKVNQTITFNAIPNKTYGDQAFELVASSDSGLPVSFTVISGPASVSGDILTINGAGNVTVEANQAGNNNYAPATPVSRSFVVSKAEATIFVSNTLQNFDGSPKEVTVSTQPEGLNFTTTYNGSNAPPSIAGTYTVEINIVEDNYSGQLISELVINSAPTTSGIPDQQVPEDSNPIQLNLLNYFSDAEDDNTSLLFEIRNNSNPPIFSEVELMDNVLKLGFEPNLNGTSSITIRCTDSNGLYIEDTFELELTPVQDPPFFTSSPVTEVLQDQEYQYFITAQDYDIGDVLSISSIISLPAWLALTDNGDGSALLSGIPSNNNVEIHGIALRVSDDKGNSANQYFDIEVIDVNDPPIFTSTPVTEAEVNKAYSYNITTQDIDQGDKVSVFAIEKPTWLTFSTASSPQGSAILRGTPTNDDRNKSQTVRLAAVDSREDSSFQTFEIVIDFPNTAPFITSEPITEATQDELYEYQVIAEDAEGDDLNINTLNLPSWLNFDDETWILSGTPGNDEVGVHNVVLEVEDFLGLKNTQNFTIKVENVNDPPTFTSTPLTVAEENQLYEYRIEVEDIDLNDNVVITVPQKPDWLNFDGENLLSGTPDLADVENSPFDVEIIATDLAGESDIQSFQIVVNLENLPPTIDPVKNPEAINEDSEETFVINLTGITDGGKNNQNISLELSTDLPNLFEELYIDYQSPNNTGKLIYKIRSDSFGIATVNIRVEDDGPGITNFVEISFQIEVIPVNDAPVFVSTPVDRIQPAEFYQYNIEATDADPNDKLTIKKTIGPDWLVLTDHKDGSATLEGQLPANFINHEISLTVTDLQNAKSTQSFLLRINELPTVSDFSVQTDEDVPYQFKTSDFKENYADPENDEIEEVKLFFSRGSLQSNGAEINSGDPIKFNENLNLQYIPPQDFFGNITLNWSASDGFVHAKTARILMEVDTVNDKPVLSNIENSIIEFIQGSEPIQITENITVSDVDDLTMDTAWVEITENYNPSEDRLLLNDITINAIEYEFNQTSGSLLITGNASKSDYELILRSVSYQNINSLSNDTNPKNISFSISDGEDQSETINREIKLSNILPELDIVNAFTPDGSGVNDTWDFINLEAFEQVNISVYNAQGVRVFHCLTNNCEWDGKFNNRKLPAGTYFYLIKLDHGRRKYEGNVTILR